MATLTMRHFVYVPDRFYLYYKLRENCSIARKLGMRYMKTTIENIYKIRVSHIIIIAGFIILLINKYANLLDFDFLDPLSKSSITLLGIIAVSSVVLFQKKSFFLILVFLFAFNTWLLTRDTTLIVFLLFAATTQSTKKKLLNTFLTVQSIILASCIITYFLALKIKFINVSLYNTGDRTRYTFFFLQPNNFGIQFAFTIICFIYISKLSSSISIAILAISSAFLYIFPNCVTGCVVLVIYALLILFFNKPDFFKKKILRFTPYLVAIIGILIFSLYLTGKTGFIGKIISGTFSYRFIGSVMAIRLYGVNLTGHYLDKLGETLFIDGQWGTFWLDFAYVRVLVEFGIIGALIFTVILIHSIRSMIRNKDYSSLILITIVLFYGLSEWGAFSALTAFPLLLTTTPSPIKASMRCIKAEKNTNSWKIIPATIQQKTSFLTD